MDLAGQKIKPAEGYLAVRFVDDDDDDDPPSSRSGSAMVSAAPEPVDYEGCLAVVAAVGDKVKIKVGATIVTRSWARDGVKLGGLTLIDSYCVLATLTE